MKAIVIRQAGRPDVLTLEDKPIPTPGADAVLIRVKAFGLNRSEMFTRQGHSPTVKFPRVLGIEAVGLVEEDRSGTFQRGQIVATAMGGMGREFDGGYAEYVSVPARQVQALQTALPWDVLGALPEMMRTVAIKPDPRPLPEARPGLDGQLSAIYVPLMLPIDPSNLATEARFLLTCRDLDQRESGLRPTASNLGLSRCSIGSVDMPQTAEARREPCNPGIGQRVGWLPNPA
jgi:Alcohol dehydrogenase GroES-like domain